MNEIKYTVLEAPVCVGSPTTGTEEAYSFLVSHGLRDVFGDSADYSPFTAERTKKAERLDPRLIELETVTHVCRGLLNNQRKAYEKGTFPITIGGDHSIVMSSVSALSEQYGTDNIAVIYVDSHADINTEKTTATGRIHGMPLAQVLGLCTDLLDIGCKNKPAVRGENIHIIGAHSIDGPEWGIMDAAGVDLYTARDVSRLGTERAAEEVLEKTKGKKVLLSFDVDSICHGEFLSTGYLFGDGLHYSEVFDLLRRFISSGTLSAFDCVEYNPSLDRDGGDLAKLLEIFRLFLL